MQAHARRALVLLSLALVTLGCASTFQYRALQGDFIQAVRIDNQAAVDPLLESSAQASYASIAAELTDERIAQLDEKLRGNAWVVRSFSEWRAGLYEKSIGSAERGSKATVLEPRDRILLALLPALAADSEAKDQWMEMGGKVPDGDAYAALETNFEQAFAELRAAERLIGDSTADSTRFYVAFHRWRILTNWRLVIASIDRENRPSPVRSEARKRADVKVGEKLSVAADAAREGIPAPHPLRQLIIALDGG